MDVQVYHDSNAQENSGIQTRNAAKKIENATAPKRTALGQLNNVRQQPARAVKNAPFKVFEDAENMQPTISKEIEKKAKATKKSAANIVSNPTVNLLSNMAAVHLPSIRQEELDNVGSPMALDVSCMETSETPVIDPLVDRDLALYCLHEYQEDIHDHLREAEMKLRPKLNYMRKQNDISPQMRTILVDWLVEVGEEYNLHDETLHLAVNYIDRFLSQMSVLRGKLQLVGTACMFIASKYEEIYPPDVGEFVYITDDTYTKRQLLRMEHLVIKVLGFDVAVPTANVFLDMYCRQLGVSSKLKCLAQYAMEMSLLDCDNYLIYKPSIIASASLFLAAHLLSNRSLGEQHPPPTLIAKVTRYEQADVAPCVQLLLKTLQTAHEQPQQAVREKYKSDSRRAVSLIPIDSV
ncbi:G2/mitotic-specific cyclin-A-like [Watersipora subatra]|uniref:G2/mitotic-specific cyclin-A-like n=1 Tax=Watersipora subatra TaxID=2589382 RepID=UPI00355C6B0E